MRWIGHRSLDLRRHPAPAAVRPLRDLCVSPGHALHVDGVALDLANPRPAPGWEPPEAAG